MGDGDNSQTNGYHRYAADSNEASKEYLRKYNESSLKIIPKSSTKHSVSPISMRQKHLIS
jgi:hypothetical protein